LGKAAKPTSGFPAPSSIWCELAMRAERKVIDKIVDGLKFHSQVSLSKSFRPIPTSASSNCHARLSAHALSEAFDIDQT
jgi:hypothetical protein